MAKFKKMRKARASVGRFFKRRGSRKSSAGVNVIETALYGAGYGVIRQPVASMLEPVTSKLPFGNYNDEAVMAIASFAAAKWGSGIIRKAGIAGLTVESYRVGALAGAGIMGSSTSNNNSAIYG